MDLNKLREDVLRAEGYGQGFKDGFASCAKKILEEEKAKPPEENTNAN